MGPCGSLASCLVGLMVPFWSLQKKTKYLSVLPRADQQRIIPQERRPLEDQSFRKSSRNSLVTVGSIFGDAGTAGPTPTSFSWSIQAAEGHICHMDVVAEAG